MPSLPLWIVVVISVSVVMVSALIALVIVRRRRQRRGASSVDPEHGSSQKVFHAIFTHDGADKPSQPCTPTTTTCTMTPSSGITMTEDRMSEKHDMSSSSSSPVKKAAASFKELDINLPLPPPTTSFFSDKLELHCDEATRLFQLYLQSSDKQQTGEFVTVSDQRRQSSAVLYEAFNQIHQKAAATLRSTLRRQKSKTRASIAAPLHQMFENTVVTSSVKDDDHNNNNNNNDHKINKRVSTAPPNVPVASTSTEKKTKNEENKNKLDNNDSSAPPAPPPKDYYLPSPVQGRRPLTLEKPRHSMASDSPGKKKQAAHDASIASTGTSTPVSSSSSSSSTSSTSIPSSTAVSAAAMAAMAGRSPPTPPPPSTTGMTPRKDTIDAFPHAPSAPHSSLTPAPPAPSLELPKDDVVSIVSGSVRRLVRDSMVQDANDHASLAARSVASSVCTNLQDIAQWWATNGENESQEHDSDDQSDDDGDKPDIVPTPSASAIPIAIDAHSATMNASRRGSTDSSTRPSAPQQQQISPLASPRASPMTSRRSSVDQTAATKQHNVDSVRRVLQATWNSHRLSDHGSVSSRSTVSHKSPPGSVNPRQLNQHLASLAIQNHQAYQSRPSLPAVFGPTAHHTDDIIFQGPAPTVSFSSSTVRTMIPENETVEAPVRPATTSTKKKPGNGASAANPQKFNKPSANNTAVPPTKQNPAKQLPSSSSAAPKKDYSKSFGTMRTGRQQRASLPWQPAATSAPGNDKTPAQKERDRYLQSLKG